MRGVLFFALHPKRLLALIGGIITAALYVWVAAVRAVPAVRERKAKAREARRHRDQ